MFSFFQGKKKKAPEKTPEKAPEKVDVPISIFTVKTPKDVHDLLGDKEKEYKEDEDVKGLDKEEIKKHVEKKIKEFINQRNDDGETPLIVASKKGYRDVVSYLLVHYKSLLDIAAEDNSGNTALMKACSYAPPSEVLIDELFMFSKEKNDRSIEKLNNVIGTNKQNENGETALILATLKGHTAIAMYLIQHGANIDLKDKDGQTAFYIACKMGNIDYLRYTLPTFPSPQPDYRKQLLQDTDKDGKTPLFIAVEKDHLEIVKHLIHFSGDFDVDTKDNSGNTPVSLALEHCKKPTKNAFEIFKLLLDKTTFDNEWLKIAEEIENEKLKNDLINSIKKREELYKKHRKPNTSGGSRSKLRPKKTRRLKHRK